VGGITRAIIDPEPASPTEPGTCDHSPLFCASQWIIEFAGLGPQTSFGFPRALSVKKKAAAVLGEKEGLQKQSQSHTVARSVRGNES
jgi:hypothetical protein